MCLIIQIKHHGWPKSMGRGYTRARARILSSGTKIKIAKLI